MERIDPIRKAASYFSPVTLVETGSEKNPYLEVTLENGKLMLNTREGNFSGGTLATVFDKAFYRMRMQKQHVTSVLLLGLGAGSVVKLLRNKYHQEAPITAIEYDEEVIALANQYFKLQEYPDLTIRCEDAQLAVKAYHETFDLVIVDLYQELEVPAWCHEEPFITRVKNCLTPGGILLFNKVAMNEKQASECSAIKSLLAQEGNLEEWVFLEFNHIIKWHKP